MKPKKKTRHGATQPETDRKAQQVLLRMLPADLALLDEIRGSMQRSAYVTFLVRLSAANRVRLPGDAS